MCICIWFVYVYICVSLCVNVYVYFVFVYMIQQDQSMSILNDIVTQLMQWCKVLTQPRCVTPYSYLYIYIIHVCIHLCKSKICKYIFCKTIPYKLIYKFTCIHIFTYIDHRYLYTKWVYSTKPLHQLQYVPPTKFARQRCHQWCHQCRRSPVKVGKRVLGIHVSLFFLLC